MVAAVRLKEMLAPYSRSSEAKEVLGDCCQDRPGRILLLNRVKDGKWKDTLPRVVSQHQNLKLPLKMTMSPNQRALVGLVCCSFLLCASATDVDYACYSGSALYERYASSKDSLLPVSRCHRLLIRSRLLCRIPTVCNRQLKPKSLRDPTVDGSTDNWSVKKRNF